MAHSLFRHIDAIFWKRKPIQLTFFVTKRCNARCPFCFYLSDTHDSQEKKPELSLAEIEKLSVSIGNLLWLAFSGGEIFLRDDLTEITKVFYDNTKPAIILLPTNGLQTDIITDKLETVLKYCKQSTIVVKLSLEGLENLHDSIRRFRGSFQKTMRTYEALGELQERYPNFELGVNTVFCSKNQANMGELINFVAGLEGIRTHTVSLIRGKVSDQRLKDIDGHTYDATIRKMEANLKKGISSIYRFKAAKFKAAQDILQRRLIHKTMLTKKRLIPCYAGKLNLVLTESGDVYPCESFAAKMGNARDFDYDLRRLLKTEQARKVIDSIKSNGCYCTHECYFMTNILFNPSLYPALVKEYLQL